MSDLSVDQSDSLWKETVQTSGCFGAQCSAAPIRGEELEVAVFTVCSFPDSGFFFISPEWRAR